MPSLVLTLSPKPGAAGQWTDQALYEIAGKLRTEVAKVDDVGLTFIVGGRPDEIRIEPDPAKLALHGVSLGALMDAVRQAGPRLPGGPGAKWRTGRTSDSRPHPDEPRRDRHDRLALGQGRRGLCPRRRQCDRGAARGSGAGLALRPGRPRLDARPPPSV